MDFSEIQKHLNSEILSILHENSFEVKNYEILPEFLRKELLRHLFSLTNNGTINAGTPFAISGVIRPRNSGASVSLMKYSAGAWKSVASATTDEQGGFSFAIAGEKRAIVRYQVLVQSDAIWRQVAAPEFSIIIR